ncbi:MAG: hypothetical protein QOJ59_2218 [Thermomicrobiales bacterium]|nr:hypothetical protein [Thermomicrobiales bacterium]
MAYPYQADVTEKVEIHHTLKHGSWLNMAEMELSVLERQCLRQWVADRDALARALAARSGRRNAAAATIDW